MQSMTLSPGLGQLGSGPHPPKSCGAVARRHYVDIFLGGGYDLMLWLQRW